MANMYFEQYLYRNQIVPGLSYRDFVAEPATVYAMNTLFWTISKQREVQATERANRKIK